jgi:hypothetical protein
VESFLDWWYTDRASARARERTAMDLALRRDARVEALRRARDRRLEEERARLAAARQAKQAEIDAALARGEEILFWASRRAATREAAARLASRARTARARRLRPLAFHPTGAFALPQTLVSISELPPPRRPTESVIPELGPAPSLLPPPRPRYFAQPGAETAAALAPFFIQTTTHPTTQIRSAFPTGSGLRRAVTTAGPTLHHAVAMHGL